MTDPTKRSEKAVVAAPDSPTPKKRPGLGMARRERVRLVGAGVLGVLLVAFAILNLDAVEVNWLLGTWSTPLIVVISSRRCSGWRSTASSCAGHASARAELLTPWRARAVT